MIADPLLPQSWEVPQVFRERLGRTVGRQRAMAADGHLLLVLHAPPAPGEDHRQGRFFWRRPDGAWTSSELGTGRRGLETHLEEYDALVDKLEMLEEEAQGPRAYFDVIRRISPLHRAATNLYHALQQARDQFPGYRDVIDLRDHAYEIQRRAELLYKVTKDGLEFETADHSEELSRRSYEMSTSAHRLNLLAAAFFPIATLSAVFGMNLRHGYENVPAPVPFVAVIAIGLVLGCGLALLVRRKPRGRRPARGFSISPEAGLQRRPELAGRPHRA